MGGRYHMKNGMIFLAVFLTAGLLRAEGPAGSVDVSMGWTALQEGKGEATVEQDAKNPGNSDPHLLRINVTKHPGPGEGRAGAVSNVLIPVQEGQWFDVTFSGVTEGASIGLVFSLESADGKVLARTTLPEIGRGRGGRGRRGPTTAPSGQAGWTKYLVALHARGADAGAHLVITAIEPTNVWLDGLTITPRSASAGDK
jgi:hypothetical protein